MATFSYQNKAGGTGTFEAPDANTALKMLPPDADPHSGIQTVLSGTGTPAPSAPALPQGGGAVPSPYALPQGGGGSPLLSFASALESAVNMARKNRNSASLDLMKPYQGTVAASDFNGILDNLNTASDKTSANLIKNATDLINPPASDIVTTTNDNGDVTAINKNTGKILWTAKGVGNKQSSGGGNGTLTETQLRQAINKRISSDPDYSKLSEPDQELYIRSLGGTPSDYISSSGFH